MKFKIRKNDIQNVLAKVQGLTGRKSNLAVTTSVLMEASGSEIRLIATDLETGLEGFYQAEVLAEGKITINAKKLFEIVRDFPSEEILINEVENYWIEIGNSHVEYHIVGLNPDDFPVFPMIKDIRFFDIQSEILRKMIDQSIVISGASDEKRAHITGLLFEIINEDTEKLVRMVSTDGNRLSTAECRFENDTSLPDSIQYIVPKKGLVELNKFIGSEEMLQIGFKDNYFIVKKDRETIVIRLLEGDFPKYRDILTNLGQGNAIKLDKQKFLMMLRRMSILSTEDYKGVVFKFSQGTLLINSTNPDIGESKEEMEMDYNGPEINVAFNPKYFTDALNCIDEANVSLHIISDEKPCYIEGEEDKHFLSVIMPMRI